MLSNTVRLAVAGEARSEACADRIEPTGVVALRPAPLSAFLIVLVAGASDGLAGASTPDGVVFVAVTLLGAATLVHASLIGGRTAKRADLERLGHVHLASTWRGA